MAVATKTSTSVDAELLADGTMTVAQAAEFTGYSVDTIEVMIKSGQLPWTQLNDKGRRLIPKRALIKILSKNMVNGGSV